MSISHIAISGYGTEYLFIAITPWFTLRMVPFMRLTDIFQKLVLYMQKKNPLKKL